MLNLPNILTFIRILTIPFFIEFLVYQLYWEALLVFAFGGLTDFLDGFLARRLKQQTALGAYLDPVADKLLVVTSFIMLGSIDAIPMWLAVLVVARDLLIVTGYAVIYFLIAERMAVRPSWIGKWSTTLQLFTLATALLSLHDAKFLPAVGLTLLVWMTATATVTSGLQYLYRGFIWLQSRLPPTAPSG